MIVEWRGGASRGRGRLEVGPDPNGLGTIETMSAEIVTGDDPDPLIVSIDDEGDIRRAGVDLLLMQEIASQGIITVRNINDTRQGREDINHGGDGGHALSGDEFGAIEEERDVIGR